ncbi:exodeoxyribonuclease VII large subunit [Acholeplasma sp. OttesenSCG-928-E16]|nr:exodeoxyribonuclease VII large subunit [Acholeplasma sp. OttesenSCG-928-E16]
MDRAITVSEITRYIKARLEGDEILRNIYVTGEISNFKRHSKGHLYFTLKDESSSISSIMFSNLASGLNFIPKDGDKVFVRGKISLYEPSGSYSIQVYEMQQTGLGELYKKLEELKNKYQSLGYFDASHKKEINKFPKKIGVVTSPTGAVIEDIRNTINRRYRLVEIILYPALVQGPESGNSIASKIKRANELMEVDTLIVGRGGGSIEDLWGFNEEVVIEAIFNSKIPIITAIGHEPDVTISDYVADKVAPTPTAAAELSTPNTVELLKGITENKEKIYYLLNEYFRNIRVKLLHLDERLDNKNPLLQLENNKKDLEVSISRLSKNINDILLSKRKDLTFLRDNLLKLDPRSILVSKRDILKNNLNILNLNYQAYLSGRLNGVNLLKEKIKDPNDLIKGLDSKVSNLASRLISQYQKVIDTKTYRYSLCYEKMESLNPLSIMDRGFALIKKDNNILTSVSNININDQIEIELKDGRLKTIVNQKEVK